MVPHRIKLKASVVAGLYLIPIVFLLGVGLYHLADAGWSMYTYWPMVACWMAAYLLGWYWTKKSKVKLPEGPPPPGYWTERDKAAWKVVEDHAMLSDGLTVEELTEVNHYSMSGQQLALKVAKIYHSDATNPVGRLTVPEILACGELVSKDLALLVEKYIPGSHLMTVNDYRRLHSYADRATTWYPRLRYIYWAISAVIDPVKTGMQIAATQAGLNPAFKGLQQNVVLWFYTTAVKEFGRYLIELHSGRLKVGAKRYQELMAKHAVPPTDFVPPTTGEGPTAPSTTMPDEPGLPVTVAVVGPVKAGKSSLVNALLGEQKAATDVLPLTAGIMKYSLRQAGLPEFTLLDTVGFGQAGATEADIQAAYTAALDADVLILVVPARSAARKPETEFVTKLRAKLAATPNLKMPPLIVALSHCDLLTPASEWAPPYDWRKGSRTKESTMRDAVAAATEQFGDGVQGFIPVCTATGKVMGVNEDLMPTVAAFLGEARGVGLLRALHLEASAEKAMRVLRQVVNAGGQVLRAFWESSNK